MSSASNRRMRRNRTRSQLAQLFSNPEHLNVVHYSCESFYDNPGGGSRRVTSIAVLNVGSAQTTSFSIHQTAEEHEVPPDDITQRYDVIERAMLAGFYQYIQERPNDHWLHWNMRDSNYGFPAIEHRFKVLGGVPATIPESHLFNLAEALPEIYGSEYVEHGEHGRLASLMQLNGFEAKDFLTGEQESDAFVSHEYVRLHQSTLRKVRIIHAFAERTWDDNLRTQGGWWQRHGATIWGVIDDWSEHPAYKLVLFFFALIGFVATVITLISWWRL